MIQIKSPKRGKQIAADENRGHRGNWISPFGVMMVEIRDEESVDALMRLSSSGHRAISTLHTNSVREVPDPALQAKSTLRLG